MLGLAAVGVLGVLHVFQKDIFVLVHVIIIIIIFFLPSLMR